MIPQNISLEELKALPLVYNKGKNWKTVCFPAIRFFNVYDILLTQIRKYNLFLCDESFAVSKERTEASFVFKVKRIKENIKFAICCNVSNTYWRLSDLYLGYYSEQKRKERLIVPYRYNLSRKMYRQGIKGGLSKWERDIDLWIKTILVDSLKLEKLAETLRSIKVKKEDYKDHVFTMGRNRIVPWTKLGKMDDVFIKKEVRSYDGLLRLYYDQVYKLPSYVTQLQRLYLIYKTMPIDIQPVFTQSEGHSTDDDHSTQPVSKTNLESNLGILQEAKN